MAHAKRYLTSLLCGMRRAGRRARGRGCFLRWGWCVPALSLGVFAEARGGEQPLPTLRFSVFAVSPLRNVTFLPRPNAAPQALVFYPTARSPRYEYRGAMPLRFADAATGALVAEAIVPPTMQDALLLFTAIEPVPVEGVRYRIAVLDDGAARHGAGGLAIVNLSGLELSGVIGPHAVVLRGGLNPTLPVGTSARIALRAAFKEKTYQSYADQLEIGQSERALLILFPPYYAGSLEVQSRLLIDRPPAPAEATSSRAR